MVGAERVELPADFAPLGISWNDALGGLSVYGARLAVVTREYSYQLAFDLPAELKHLAQMLPTEGIHAAEALVAIPAISSIQGDGVVHLEDVDERSGYVVHVAADGRVVRLLGIEEGADPSRLYLDPAIPLAAIDHLAAFEQAVVVDGGVTWVRRNPDGAAVVSTGGKEVFRFRPNEVDSRLRLSSDLRQTRVVELSQSGSWTNAAVCTRGRWRKDRSIVSPAGKVVVPFSNDTTQTLSIGVDAMTEVLEVSNNVSL